MYALFSPPSWRIAVTLAAGFLFLPTRANVFAVEAKFNPSTGVLAVSGTGGDDRVTVVDPGTTTAGGTVQVYAGLNLILPIFTTPANRAVKEIVIDTGGGDDAVVYKLNGSAAEKRSVRIDLGGGDDAFTMTLAKGLTAGADWSVEVRGDDGDDALAAPLAGAVERGASLTVAFAGGDGRDALKQNYAGELNGTLKLLQEGGAEADGISSTVTLAKGSGGLFEARQLGGAGDDAHTLNVVKENRGDRVRVTARIDGGPGRNRCEHTDNVTAVNCR